MGTTRSETAEDTGSQHYNAQQFFDRKITREREEKGFQSSSLPLVWASPTKEQHLENYVA
ncbi:hypothetical protein L195_g051693 [Trifolium pratense]|uniref:Uncharacterized protein n=1 Tax=Trifolium pratense TaxID=57577 RepID=A0A2K3K0Z1_TRIPR|nr:hypothetical protein L195_g051693 [Trifolium pratense]